MELFYVSTVNMGSNHRPEVHDICIPALYRKLAVFVFPELPLKLIVCLPASVSNRLPVLYIRMIRSFTGSAMLPYGELAGVYHVNCMMHPQQRKFVFT